MRSGVLDRRAARRRTTRIVDEFDVRTPGIDVAAFTLSGGNQQKLIVGREMTAEPRVLLAAHPTRGVDVGAQAGIWDILRDARGSRSRHAARVGRPRGADRPVRPIAGDAPRSCRRRARSGNRDTERPRFLHDRCSRREGAA